DRINMRFMMENLHTARVASPGVSDMTRRSVDYELRDRLCQGWRGPTNVSRQVDGRAGTNESGAPPEEFAPWALSKGRCSLRILTVAHLRTPAYWLREHGRRNTIWRALDQTPDEGAANAETHHHELVDAEVIHQADLVIGVRLPRSFDVDRSAGLAARRVAQV